LGGVTFAHKGMQPVIDAIIELAEHAAKEPFDFKADDTDAIKAKVKDAIGADLRAAYGLTKKSERQAALAVAKDKAMTQFAKSDANPDGYDSNKLGGVFKELEGDIVRRAI